LPKRRKASSRSMVRTSRPRRPIKRDILARLCKLSPEAHDCARTTPCRAL
jgi:hypothetical protein